MLQRGVSEILGSIYEQDFLDNSYGYRPGTGAQNAVRDLSRNLQFGSYGWVVEADIKGFFDNIDHEWMMRMLEERVDDKTFLRLIRKWLKAGILETDGQVLQPETGTPQGGIVSPVLANIYLHYALDLRFEKVVKPRCRGKAFIIRYADDFVCAFQYYSDAEKFYSVLGSRLEKFGLELAEDKTRLFPFSRFKVKRGERFCFLGLEFCWGTSRKGKPLVCRRTSRKKLRAALADFTFWIKNHRSRRLKNIFRTLASKYRGHWNYYGVYGNFESLRSYFRQTKMILYKWLNCRSQRKNYSWQGFNDLLKQMSLPSPRITEKRVPN